MTPTLSSDATALASIQTPPPCPWAFTADPSNLVGVARHLHRQIPVRLARRIVELDHGPARTATPRPWASDLNLLIQNLTPWIFLTHTPQPIPFARLWYPPTAVSASTYSPPPRQTDSPECRPGAVFPALRSHPYVRGVQGTYLSSLEAVHREPTPETPAGTPTRRALVGSVVRFPLGIIPFAGFLSTRWIHGSQPHIFAGFSES